MKERIDILRQFSIPLICGVILALIWANIDPHSYHDVIHAPLLWGASLHFLTNDIFMALFFGIAAVEITQSCIPGGDLNPPGKAVNPLVATVGGVVGPALVYLGLNSIIGAPELARGWGIPTATDIAFAWVVARFVFGEGHPAIPFLLLLAVADDAIGLAIIAIFYPDPNLPVQPEWLLLTVAGMAVAYGLRRKRLSVYWPFLLFAGVPSWLGLLKAHLHPALALVFIIPFVPHGLRERFHVFEEDVQERSPLSRFEHDWKVVVDFGMFVFGLVNAGVAFGEVGTATVLVVAALLLGKTVGISLFGLLAARLGFAFPAGMGIREVVVAAMIGGFGFTVALFVSGEAFTDPAVQQAAKMGALLSFLAAPAAWGGAKILRVGEAAKGEEMPAKGEGRGNAGEGRRAKGERRKGQAQKAGRFA